jgi:hypothetical protein
VNPLVKLARRGAAVQEAAKLIGSSMGISNGRWFLTGTGRDFVREAGDVYDNSVVQTLINLESTMLEEVQLGIQELKNPKEPHKEESWEWVTPDRREYDIVRAIRNPNRFHDGGILWKGTILSDFVNGNGYWLKRRSREISRTTGLGRPVGFWYVPHFQAAPSAADQVDPLTGEVFTQSGSDLVTCYEYSPIGGGELRYLPPSALVHFRDGVDPRAMNRGLSPLFGALRDIVSENEAAGYAAAIMSNMGIPGVIMSSKTPIEEQTDAERKQLRQSWNQFTKDRRGEPFVSPVPVEVSKIAMTPRDMLADELRTIPATRICALVGYDPIRKPARRHGKKRRFPDSSADFASSPTRRSTTSTWTGTASAYGSTPTRSAPFGTTSTRNGSGFRKHSLPGSSTGLKPRISWG